MWKHTHSNIELKYCSEFISSVESQKGVIAVQSCSIENEKGTITIDFVKW